MTKRLAVIIVFLVAFFGWFSPVVLAQVETCPGNYGDQVCGDTDQTGEGRGGPDDWGLLDETTQDRVLGLNTEDIEAGWGDRNYWLAAIGLWVMAGVISGITGLLKKEAFGT